MTMSEANKMIGFIRSQRYIITVILALTAIVIEYYYSICGTACSYLRGDVFGIALQHIGIGYMTAVIVLAILKKDTFLIILLSAGVGIEVYLVGFQVWYTTYCDYCLAFAAALVLQFFVNCDWKRKRLIVSSMVIALVLFSIVFRGSATPAYADDTPLSAFGKGKVAVRLYTDYFCSPCKAMEPSLEPVITDLVQKNIVTFTFVDTPFYQLSSLYVRYFLYALNEKKDFGHGIAVRNALIEASNKKIGDAAKLEEFLKEKGIKIKPFDPKPTFDLFGKYLRDDKIKATPSCVIEKDGKMETSVGGFDIIQALQKLKK